MRSTWSKVAIDLVVWGSMVPLAYVLRFDDGLPARLFSDIAIATVVALALKAIAIAVFGLASQSWTKFTFRDSITLIRAVVFVALTFYAIMFLVDRAFFVPRSIPILDGVLGLFALAAVRALARRRDEGTLASRVDAGAGTRVLIVGAGEAGTMIARELLRRPDTGLVPVGFLDDDPQKLHDRIATVRVVGRLADLERCAQELDAQEVLIAMPSAPGDTVRDVVMRARAAGVRQRIIPGVYSMLQGHIGLDVLRDVQVEDLLRRTPVRLDTSAIASYIHGRTLLVTGAGGSIGSEVVNEACRFRPTRVILLGRGENSIYDVARRTAARWPEIDLVSVICDVRDRERLDRVFALHKPDVVFHAAAHKHVPLMEANEEEAVLNNVVGTGNVAETSARHGVRHLVNVSTDKAINPSSVMGATKRVAEMVVQSVAGTLPAGHAYVSVRFGNVLGSRGSVIPLFTEQIRAGGPITVTHPDMTRYFMTIPEAARLVIQTGGLATNGEVFILDMGEPVKVVDVARDLIRLAGLEPDRDVPIVFTGVRPGEKLFEELMDEQERHASTTHDKIFRARASSVSPAMAAAAVEELTQAALAGSVGEVRRILNALVEGAGIGDSQRLPTSALTGTVHPEGAIAPTTMPEDAAAGGDETGVPRTVDG